MASTVLKACCHIDHATGVDVLSTGGQAQCRWADRGASAHGSRAAESIVVPATAWRDRRIAPVRLLRAIGRIAVDWA